MEAKLGRSGTPIHQPLHRGVCPVQGRLGRENERQLSPRLEQTEGNKWGLKIQQHRITHTHTFLDVNIPSVGGGIHSAAHRSCCPDGQVLMLRNTRAHEAQHQHQIHHAATHLQLFNDFKQLRVLTGTKSQLRSGSSTGEEKEKGREADRGERAGQETRAKEAGLLGHGKRSGILNYAKASDGFTFWLLLAVMNDLPSVVGESSMSSIRSSVTASVLQQQVHLSETV